MYKQKLSNIIDQLTAALEDANKFDQNNDSAGRRVRSAAQQARNDLQNLRLEIQTERNNRKS